MDNRIHPIQIRFCFTFLFLLAERRKATLKQGSFSPSLLSLQVKHKPANFNLVNFVTLLASDVNL